MSGIVARTPLIDVPRASRIRALLDTSGIGIGELIAAAHQRTGVVSPAFRTVLPLSPAEQCRRMTEVGVFLLRRLDRLHIIDISVVNMGVALDRAGITRVQLAVFRREFLAVAAQRLGVDWTAEVSADWTGAAGAIESVLTRGMRVGEANAAA